MMQNVRESTEIRELRMIPDSKTHARVGKFPIGKIFFEFHLVKYGIQIRQVSPRSIRPADLRRRQYGHAAAARPWRYRGRKLQSASHHGRRLREVREVDGIDRHRGGC